MWSHPLKVIDRQGQERWGRGQSPRINRQGHGNASQLPWDTGVLGCPSCGKELSFVTRPPWLKWEFHLPKLCTSKDYSQTKAARLTGVTGLGLPGAALSCPRDTGALGFPSYGKELSFEARCLVTEAGICLLKLNI